MTTLYIHDDYIGMVEPKKVYYVVQFPNSDECVIASYIQNGKELTFDNLMKHRFPNPLDAYFFLLENIKEEEIV